MHCTIANLDKALRIKEKQIREESIQTISDDLIAKYFSEGDLS